MRNWNIYASRTIKRNGEQQKGYGNIVMDPFAGSGTTLLAAQNLGIDYLGIEINPEYAQISKKRLQKAQIP